MWSQAEFDQRIQREGEILETIYQQNKTLFDAAVKNGLISLRKKEARISDGGGVVSVRISYCWEPKNTK